MGAKALAFIRGNFAGKNLPRISRSVAWQPARPVAGCSLSIPAFCPAASVIHRPLTCCAQNRTRLVHATLLQATCQHNLYYLPCAFSRDGRTSTSAPRSCLEDYGPCNQAHR